MSQTTRANQMAPPPPAPGGTPPPMMWCWVFAPQTNSYIPVQVPINGPAPTGSSPIPPPNPGLLSTPGDFGALSQIETPPVPTLWPSSAIAADQGSGDRHTNGQVLTSQEGGGSRGASASGIIVDIPRSEAWNHQSPVQAVPGNVFAAGGMPPQMPSSTPASQASPSSQSQGWAPGPRLVFESSLLSSRPSSSSEMPPPTYVNPYAALGLSSSSPGSSQQSADQGKTGLDAVVLAALAGRPIGRSPKLKEDPDESTEDEGIQDSNAARGPPRKAARHNLADMERKQGRVKRRTFSNPNLPPKYTDKLSENLLSGTSSDTSEDTSDSTVSKEKRQGGDLGSATSTDSESSSDSDGAPNDTLGSVSDSAFEATGGRPRARRALVRTRPQNPRSKKPTKSESRQDPPRVTGNRLQTTGTSKAGDLASPTTTFKEQDTKTASGTDHETEMAEFISGKRRRPGASLLAEPTIPRDLSLPVSGRSASKRQRAAVERLRMQTLAKLAGRENEPRKEPPSPRDPITGKRRPGRRSRGCWTCKCRRKKCDERRPHCEACEILGLKCDGYSVERPDFMKDAAKNTEYREMLSRIVRKHKYKYGHRVIDEL